MRNSPISILYNKAGYPLDVSNDGGVYRLVAKIIGAGVAGTPDTSVVTIQGITGGTPLPITGNITASNESTSLTNNAIPQYTTLFGGSDGTNLRSARMFDLDTGAGSEYNLGISIRLPASGGSVVGGTSTNPFRIDPTGTTTQPVSIISLPLPLGAATESSLSNLLTESTFTSRINTLGQKNMASSMPVVISSNQTAIPVSVIDGAATQSKTAYDISDTVIYIGTAELASSTSSAVWLIKRITLVDGTPTFIEWSDNSAIWDNRVSEIYQ